MHMHCLLSLQVAIVLLATISLALAEPPVPSSEYLPANQYIPPSTQYGAPKPFSLPSATYGAPAQTQAVIRPNNVYGPPKPVYGAPGAAYLPPGGGYGKGYEYEGVSLNPLLLVQFQTAFAERCRGRNLKKNQKHLYGLQTNFSHAFMNLNFSWPFHIRHFAFYRAQWCN